MSTTMKMAGTTVLVVTPQKTKYPEKDQKFYKKKNEKKRRDRNIRNNRRAKMEGNNLYSQKEYGRHNGSQPFEIYDRFTVVDKDHHDVDRQFMTRKEFDYSRHCIEVWERELDDYMYCDEEVRQKRARSESSDEETQPAKKRKEYCTPQQQMREYQRAREERLGERLEYCSSNGITLRQLEINDYWQAKKDIETTRHNLEMTKIDYYWMSDLSREYLTDPDPFDSDDDW